MKKGIFYLILLAYTGANAQTIPYEKLDSISSVISTLQFEANELTYNDGNKDYEISFSKENFKLLFSTQLGYSSVYKKSGDNEILSLTENIDFTKAENITIEVAGSQVVVVKVVFPQDYLVTQFFSEGNLITSTKSDFLEFFCKYQEDTKLNLYNALAELCTNINKKNLKSTKDIETNIDLNIAKRKNPTSYLLKAVEKDDVKEFNYLVGLGANVRWANGKGESLLHLAIVEESDNIFKLLIELKSDIEQMDFDGNTPLIKAIIENKPKYVYLLLENGANPINKNSVTNQPPIYYALINSYTNSGETLIEHGVNPNEPITLHFEKFTLLYLAINETKSILFAGSLITNGARINDLSENGLSPLMAAVNQKSTYMVKYLLNRGADINFQGKGNKTALHLAVQNQDAEMVTYLIQRGGANKEALDNIGNTPRMLAKNLNNKTIEKDIKSSESLVNLSSSYSDQERQYSIGLEKLAILKIIHTLKSERRKKRILVYSILALTGVSAAVIIIGIPEAAALVAIPGGVGLGLAGGLGFEKGKDLRTEKRKIKEINTRLLAAGFVL